MNGIDGTTDVVPADVIAVQQLAARYWARADGLLETPMSELFTDAAVLSLGSLTLTGCAAIEDFFRQRDAAQDAGRRTTRHVVGSFLAEPAGPGRVRVRSTVLVYAGSGDLPLPATVPSGIADFDDTCVLIEPGRWKFERRSGRTVFIGADAPAFARS